MTRYQCCGGYMPCSGKLKEKNCPECCLCIEAFFCFVQSVMATRWMLQDEFNIQTTPCDNCLISLMFVIKQLSCICSLLAIITCNDNLNNVAECLRSIADLTQHKIEMDKRDGLITAVPETAMGVPPVQQMSRADPEIPPPVTGIPAQQVVYAYPAPAAGLPSHVFASPEPSTGLYPPVFAPGPYPAFNQVGIAPPNPGQLPPPVFNPEPHPPPNQDQPPPVLGPGHPPPSQKMM
ncbi:hypothetical protein Cgig2_033443 [Carnegiea gigantea]|uniref:Uncharacterized protein n=1 Tax=Carnegiea gigantea TaxID=171969 RepID=A0A9Q1KWM0_9CARY|nr:hypothetical protein Cgig2_033443 [Carnegiea gigantea]